MKSQRKERQTKAKHGVSRLLNSGEAAEQKRLAMAMKDQQVDSQGMRVLSVPSPSSEPESYSQSHALIQAQVQLEAQAQAQALVHQQAQQQAQEEHNKAVAMAQAQAQIHAQIQAQLQAQCQSNLQAFLNSSDSEMPPTIVPSQDPASCGFADSLNCGFSDSMLGSVPQEMRLQAAFASLSAALQLSPTSFYPMSGGSHM